MSEYIWGDSPAFQADSLASEQLRREVNSGLQVVENWNSAETVVFYGKDSQLTGAAREHAEVSMLALHLLQSAMVHINTLLLQAVLEDPQFHDLVGDNERRALSQLFWSNINLYGRFRLDMDTRLDLTRELVTGQCPARGCRLPVVGPPAADDPLREHVPDLLSVPIMATGS